VLGCYRHAVEELELPPEDGPLDRSEEEGESSIGAEPLGAVPEDGADDFDDAVSDLPMLPMAAAYLELSTAAELGDDSALEVGLASPQEFAFFAEESITSEAATQGTATDFLGEIDEGMVSDDGGDEGPEAMLDPIDELPPADDDDAGELGLDDPGVGS
jgi:hypothetical protein